MKTDSMKRLMVGLLVIGAMALQTPAAMAGSITMTNNLHQGTDLDPEGGFSLTSTGLDVLLGNVTSSASVTSSATGAVTSAVTDSLPTEGAYAEVLPGDVMGTNTNTFGVANWIEVANFNASSSATYISPNDGSIELANTLSSYSFFQDFTATGTASYHFDYEAIKFIEDPPVAGLESVFGTSTFQFFLGTKDVNGNILDFVTTGLMSFTDSTGYLFGDLSFDIANGYGFYGAITTADATATVPEPGTFLLLGLGLGGLAIYRRRRQVNG